MATTGPTFTQTWSNVSWCPVYVDTPSPLVTIYRYETDGTTVVARGTFVPAFPVTAPLWVAVRDDDMGILYCDYGDTANFKVAKSTDGGYTWLV